MPRTQKGGGGIWRRFAVPHKKILIICSNMATKTFKLSDAEYRGMLPIMHKITENRPLFIGMYPCTQGLLYGLSYYKNAKDSTYLNKKQPKMLGFINENGHFIIMYKFSM